MRALLVALAVLLAQEDAFALPTVIPSSDADRRMAEARERIKAHPAADRVDLLVDAPGTVQPNVYVFPRDGQASAELELLVEPSCVEMQRAVDDVNALTDAVFAIADANLARALEVAQAKTAYLDFLAANKEALGVAAEGSIHAHTLEGAIATLESALAEVDAQIEKASRSSPPNPHLPELQAQRTRLAGDLAARRSELMAVRADPSYLAAWAVAAEADRILDRVRQAQKSLADQSASSGLDAALEAANAAKVAFNDLARVDAAVGEADFPILDAEVIDLIWQRQRSGERWFPGYIENLAWQVPAGILLESPPFTYRIYKRFGSIILPMDEVLPPIAATSPGTTAVEVLAAGQVLRRQTQIGGGDDGIVRVRTTSLLQAQKPRVRVRLGMGTYCGQVEVKEVTKPPAESSEGVLAAPAAKRFRLVPRSDRLLFTQTAVADFETPVLGPELRSRCFLHSDAYSAAVRGGTSAKDMLFWSDVAQWDLTARRRVGDIGMVCDFPPEAVRFSEGVRHEAEWISQLAVWETAAMFLELAGAPPSSPPPPTSPLVEAYLRSFPDPAQWSSALHHMCQNGPVCQLALADPAVFDEHCTTEPDGHGGQVTRCAKQSLWTSFEFQRSGAYWQPMRLTSRIGFRLKEVP
jgi:hypothetical protein